MPREERGRISGRDGSGGFEGGITFTGLEENAAVVHREKTWDSERD
jgi:hypothetical protein